MKASQRQGKVQLSTLFDFSLAQLTHITLYGLTAPETTVRERAVVDDSLSDL